MPRQPRIDAPGLLYHVIARGIERSNIFKDDNDRNEFLRRLGKLLSETRTPLYAFALMPNHFHLLIKRFDVPVSTLMQRLLTSYALHFNRRHRRSGHLFQNRYKAFVCQNDLYLLELIRYINLNPLRARLVKNPEELKKYLYSGHGYVLGRLNAEWFETQAVMAFFGDTGKAARRNYAWFVSEGVESGPREEPEVVELKHLPGFSGGSESRDETACGNKELGLGSFVEGRDLTGTTQEAKQKVELEEIVAGICREFLVDRDRLLGSSKTRQVAEARRHLAYRMERELCLTRSQIARTLTIGSSAVTKMIKRVENFSVRGQ